jgi:hypothetical protein
MRPVMNLNRRRVKNELINVDQSCIIRRSTATVPDPSPSPSPALFIALFRVGSHEGERAGSRRVGEARGGSEGDWMGGGEAGGGGGVEREKDWAARKFPWRAARSRVH